MYQNNGFSAEVVYDPPTETTITLKLTAPVSQWRRIRDYLGAATDDSTPFEFYDVLTDALDEAD